MNRKRSFLLPLAVFLVAPAVAAAQDIDGIVNVVRASTDSANAASIRVREKLGCVLVRRGLVGGIDTVFYELPRAFPHAAGP